MTFIGSIHSSHAIEWPALSIACCLYQVVRGNAAGNKSRHQFLGLSMDIRFLGRGQQ